MTKTNILVNFSITGDIIPDEISTILNIEPTKKVNKGDIRIGNLIAKRATWEVGIGYTDTIELDTQLKKLIVDTGLVRKLDELLHIQKNYDVIIRLTICININTKNFREKPVIWIDPIISKFVGELGVAIDTDIYFQE